MEYIFRRDQNNSCINSLFIFLKIVIEYLVSIRFYVRFRGFNVFLSLEVSRDYRLEKRLGGDFMINILIVGCCVNGSVQRNGKQYKREI